MKKKRLNLPKLSLSKEIISSLSQEKITGGATINTCYKTCIYNCQPPTLRQLSCICPVTTDLCPVN
ncbi:class I lanthipeptide [Chitinophaga qingshengii]|uniref:Class I lanthipeptide n=1 Tax=Chitinophaga qingshengii TaxID=1569794 RepID=A0ABR7TX05_9BACT|nr:class I lanthipeptide [Chitinophaga qingshengii]MBC9933534.1 class I lanthipeptide [Chitinophaga qingshengii]